jgi:hypothetical protein
MIKRIAYALAAALLASSAQATTLEDIVGLPLNAPTLSDIIREQAQAQKAPSKNSFPQFTAADRQALAINWTQLVLPPPEYDHPYSGRLTILDGGDQEQMRSQCRILKSAGIITGCMSYRDAESCTILHAREQDIVKAAWTLNIVIRHEIAHCNGWPPGHPNAR